MAYRINRNTEIVIGHEGEKGFREARFDVSELPEGIIYLEHLRYGDAYAYPIRLDRVGDEAIWIPNETDTAKRGTGRGQLVCYVGDEVVAKTDVFKLINRYSLATTDEVPDGYDSWIQRLETLGAVIEGKTVDGLNTINEAKDSALDRISTVSADGIEAINEAKAQGVSAVGNAKDSALGSIEAKKEAVHTELDGYVEAHRAELTPKKGVDYFDGEKGEKGDAYIVTDEDLKEIGDRVEAEYEPNLNALKEEVSHKAEATDLALANRKIKALTDVLNGKELAFETNDYESAKVEVPSGAVADSVLKIGGKSVVWNQLCNNAAYPITVKGLTITKNGNTFTVNGTSTESGNYIFCSTLNLIVGHKYCVIGCAAGGSTSTYRLTLGGIIIDTGNGGIWTNPSYPSTFVRLDYASGIEFKNLVFKPRCIDLTQMFGAGNEPTDVDDPRIKAIEEYAEAHPQYNGGELMSSQTDAVGVRGKNLLDVATYPLNENRAISTSTGDTYATGSSGIWYATDKYIPCGNFKAKTIYTSPRMSVCFYDKSKTFISGSSSGLDGANPFTVPADAEYMRFDIHKDYVESAMVQVGERVTEYSPYSYEQIPTNLPILRSAGSVSDEIDLKNRKKIIRTHLYKLTADNITGIYRTLTSNTVSVRVSHPKPIKSGLHPNMVVAGGETADFYQMYNPIDVSVFDKLTFANHRDLDGNIYAIKYGLDTLQAYKDYVTNNDVFICYAIVTEEIEDIDPIPQLEAINVEAGGEVSFVDHSDMSFAIPSTHEWVVRNSEV